MDSREFKALGFTIKISWEWDEYSYDYLSEDWYGKTAKYPPANCHYVDMHTGEFFHTGTYNNHTDKLIPLANFGAHYERGMYQYWIAPGDIDIGVSYRYLKSLPDHKQLIKQYAHTGVLEHLKYDVFEKLYRRYVGLINGQWGYMVCSVSIWHNGVYLCSDNLAGIESDSDKEYASEVETGCLSQALDTASKQAAQYRDLATVLDTLDLQESKDSIIRQFIGK